MANKYAPKPKWRRNEQPNSGCSKATTIRMTPDELDLVKAMAASEFLSMNTLVRKAIHSYAELSPTQTHSESAKLSA